MPTAQPKRPNQIELKEEYIKMMVLMGEVDGPAKLESYILGKGRTEMHYLIAYLFMRCAMAEIKLLHQEEPDNPHFQPRTDPDEIHVSDR